MDQHQKQKQPYKKGALMKRTQLLTLLHDYNPTDMREQEYKKRMIDFVQQHDDCFERSLEVGHITASAWLLNEDKTKALLMHHAKFDLWVQPGGHCDGNSDVLAVAVKEAQEESGIQNLLPVTGQIFDLDIHLIPATPKEKSLYHYDVRFLLQAVDDEPLVQNHESKELRWIGKDRSSLPTNEPSVVRMFDKWVANT
jgi:8-oxo-dGTP pyrophosphatase MutT (NUDIX family)